MGKKYKNRGLASNDPTLAPNVEPNLINGWGEAVECHNVWVCSADGGVVILFDKCGKTIKIVGVTDNEQVEDNPTGIVLNESKAFVVSQGGSSASSEWLICTEGGNLYGYSPLVDNDNAIQTYNGGPNAKYTGLDRKDDILYVANFLQITGTGSVDVFDGNWQPLASYPFIDPDLPANYSPFNVKIIDDNIYVIYALNTDGDETIGDGFGLVNLFDLNGTFIKRVVDPGDALNAPWNLIEGPRCSGKIENKLLISSFGDGTTNIYNKAGTFEGKLEKCNGDPLVIPFIWGLVPLDGNFYAASGPNDENNGLFSVVKRKKCCDH